MHETFNAIFDFNEATVVCNVRNLTEHASLRRITARKILPWIITKLLHAKRYTLTFAVELEDLDVDFLAHFHNLGRMLDALPGHIGDVQETIDTTEVDECAVIGEVLDNTLDGVAFLKFFQECLTLCGVFFLDNSTT